MPFRSSQFSSNSRALLAALSKALAIIEFDPRGNILAANENFCNAMGYDLQEIVGKHHRMFVDPHYAQTRDYADFWGKLGRGEFDAREYQRFAKGGRSVWIQACYIPVMSGNRVQKVVKVATDITNEKLKAAENASKLDPIFREQAVIEFNVEGDILTANDNFLRTVGYSLEEVRGRHHRMFVDQTYANSSDYREFWPKLGRGEFVSGEFKRVGKSGNEIWLQASYNPIFDPNGKVTKVVKFASDITGRIHAVNEVGAALARLAKGDLEQRIETPFDPALESLRADFNQSLDALQPAMARVRGNAESIRAGADHILASSQDLSRRTEQQAGSLEETAAALDQITATVRRTAEGAKHAREVVGNAKADAEQSGEVVREAVAAMDAIEKSSGQISQIIGVIDEIAFQTNLLALNAGVEAARAGDAGRGFAVVASEVRALAQRSAEAAKEIKTLISTSTTQVERGATLVGQAGKVLERIVEKVADTNRIINDIAASAQEQSTGLDQINIAVNQMDEMTQKNAAMVQESGVAVNQLARQSEDLTGVIAGFRIGDEVRQAYRAVSSNVKRPALRAAAGGR
jgi:methyl-accepting chemotaxis protein